MNTAKHTPGPWILGSSGVCVWASDGSPVADVFECNDRPLEEYKANARLMATAPKLLENLKDAVRFLDALETKLGHAAFVDVMPNNCHGRNDMRTAISEAEGGGQ